MGGQANDALAGGPGDDTITPGPGDDAVSGGAGEDAVDYSDRTQPVTIIARHRAARPASQASTTRSRPTSRTRPAAPATTSSPATSGDNYLVGGAGNDVADGRRR